MQQDKDFSDSENDDNGEHWNNEHYDEEDSYDDENIKVENNVDTKSDAEENTKTNLKRFTKNRSFITAIISAYQKQSLLWDSVYKTKKANPPEKQKAFESIKEEINQKFKIQIKIKQIEHIIKRLKLRYLHQTRLRNSGQSYKSSWFFDLLKFLDPHCKENRVVRTELPTIVCILYNYIF